MKGKDDVGYYLTMLALTAPSAAIVWFVFRGVYQDLTRSSRVVEYIDPMTQMGITLGYYTMVIGTIVLVAMAAWSTFQLLRLLFLRRP